MTEYETGTVAKAIYQNGGPLPAAPAIIVRAHHGWHVVPLPPYYVSSFHHDVEGVGTLTDIRPQRLVEAAS